MMLVEWHHRTDDEYDMAYCFYEFDPRIEVEGWYVYRPLSSSSARALPRNWFLTTSA
jgi:hypothetical protein